MWRSVGFTRTASYPLAANPRKQQFYPIESARFRRFSERHAPCAIFRTRFFPLFIFLNVEEDFSLLGEEKDFK